MHGVEEYAFRWFVFSRVRALLPAIPAVAATGLIFTSNELLYAGVDPNEMRFKRTGCFDVGVECGGWGRIVLELRVVDREEIREVKS